MKTVIVIPARYASTRLPAKPLAIIAGQTMLQRVVAIAQAAAQGHKDVDVLVATDHEKIAAHAQELDVDCVMTPANCRTGTERAAVAIAGLKTKPDFILGLQGDAPLTPPDFLAAMIESFRQSPCDVLTPVTRISWEELDRLRDHKKTTPFSGTTAVFNQQTGAAYWFSKNILPAMRNEPDLRKDEKLSPVWRHIGLYGYSLDMLNRYGTLTETPYEELEGLEQLRVIENGHTIRCVPVDYKGRASMSGIDSPEDIARAEFLIARHGELL